MNKRGNRRVSNFELPSSVKREDDGNDLILSQLQTMNQHKQEVKREYDGESQKQMMNERKPSKKIISWCSSKSSLQAPHSKNIVIASSPDLEAELPPVRPGDVFQAKDIWNSERSMQRQLKGGSADNPVNVPNLKPLPQDKYVFSKYEQYHPIGQIPKKKQYRPVVPRQFVSGYDTYLTRLEKNGKEGAVVDLGVCGLERLVEICYNWKVLPIDLTTIFLCKSGTNQIVKQFIDRWEKGTLHYYNFEDHPFTLADHRRLSQLLLQVDPDRFTIGRPIQGFHLNEKEFYYRTYSLNAEDYVKLYLTLDAVSGCSWWHRLRQQQHLKDYITVKEAAQQPLVSHLSREAKSLALRDLLGPLKLQDTQAELEKILTNKFQHPQRREQEERTFDEHGTAEEEDFEEASGDAVEQSSRYLRDEEFFEQNE